MNTNLKEKIHNVMATIANCNRYTPSTE